MQTIKVQIRIECAGTEKERAIAFWRESGELYCFTWSDGHNIAYDEYRLRLPMASHIEAAEFIESLQRHYDSTAEYDGHIRIQLVQRLSRQ